MTDLERCLTELSRRDGTMSRAALVLAVMEARKRKAEAEKMEDR
jgi:hypothetical protein